MSVERLNALADSAIASLEAGDYQAAIRSAVSAKILLAVQPNLSRSASGNAQQLGWYNVQAVDGFITECRRQQTQTVAAASGPFQQTKIRYKRPDTESAYD